jgi:hypothetical protein
VIIEEEKSTKQKIVLIRQLVMLRTTFIGLLLCWTFINVSPAL